MNTQRAKASVFIYNNKVMIAGGLDNSGIFNRTIEIYNEDKKVWEAIGPTLHKGLHSSII